MKNNIYVPNCYTDIDLGNGNFVRKYDSLDIEKELNSETPIISVQKTTIQSIDGILELLGIKDKSSIGIKKALGRCGYTKLKSKDLGDIGILATKGSDSTLSFAEISDYYLGGNDIGNNIQFRGIYLEELGKISGKKLWGYKTELLFILGLNSVNRVINNGGNLTNFEVDILATKFTPTLTQKAINKLPEFVKKPSISTVDSNSELVVQILECGNVDSIVGGVEIVQSGESLIATNNAVIRNGELIMPGLRNAENGELEGLVISDINPESQVGQIANSIQTNIDVSLYKILNKSKKPMEFIDAILKNMTEK